MIGKNAFKQCASCAAKPGSPRLCESCLHNRTVIGRLYSKRKKRIEKARKKGQMQGVLTAALVGVQSFLRRDVSREQIERWLEMEP